MEYAGEGPAYSEELGAWLVVTDGGDRVRIADDEAGERLWPTATEEERAAKEIAQAELAQLRAQLAALKGR